MVYASRAMAIGLLLVATVGVSADDPATATPEAGTAVAIFAGGCFWCMEHPFDELVGVIATTSGYTGGNTPNPTYEQVSAGGTAHAESVRVTYDPSKVSYEKLLDVYWRNIDPLAVDRQFCDEGSQYRSAIFYTTREQQTLAEASKQKVQEEFDKPIATQIVAAGRFYPAEEYHQDYYRKNPLRYKFYRLKCGRDQRLQQLWGPPNERER
ncbi:MAG TPA: peptide-methionine (S)-S-oxide reductase MsrA [Pseudomonadales bacterium]|nr:peptide-methionine (S)-S-oxide reductase MsrA [Pseudomonadales bacterium]